MIDRQQRIQALYEISLSITPKETLAETADDALLGYLQKLNCSVGAIFHSRSTRDGTEYEPIAAVPTVPESNETVQTISEILREASTHHTLTERLPIVGETAGGVHYYIFELPEFGVLALGKCGGTVDEITRSALRPLNEKLAEACRNQQTEEALRIEHNRFEAVFDAIPEPVANTVVVDGTERVAQINTPFEATFGYTELTARGQPIDSLITPVNTDSGPNQQPTGSDPHEITCETATGPCEFLCRRVAVDTAGADEYIHLYVDISAQKQSQRELARYERLVENLPIGVYRTTPGPDGEFRLVNQGLVDILEADSPSDFESLSVSDLYADPEARKAFSDRLLEHGEVDATELELHTLDGNPICVSITGRAVEENGHTVFELALQDITKRKQRQQQLAVLSRVLRHNLRNAMNVIRGNTRLLGEAVDSELQPQIEAIEKRVENLEQLSHKAGTMRSLFEQGREVSATLEMCELLAEIQTDFESKYPEAELTVADAESVSVQADVRLKMALIELLDNAVVHNDAVKPSIDVTAAPADAKPSDSWVDITITDNGPGIPDCEWQAIQSGEETPLHHGTGLGLWLVYWTVSLLGGEITASAVDSGSRIVLTLPRAAVEPASTTAAS